MMHGQKNIKPYSTIHFGMLLNIIFTKQYKVCRRQLACVWERTCYRWITI